MTAQVPDSIRYDGKYYAIAAIERAWPFDPNALGLRKGCSLISTACWRGYEAGYEVRDGFLFLVRLRVLYYSHQSPPSWNGLEPRLCTNDTNMWEYPDLRYPIDYSGGLIIGRGFLQEFYVHMGFQRPHCYEVVHELAFEHGWLRQATDHSLRMEFARELIRSGHGEWAGVNLSRDDTDRFIDESFSMSYDKKWP
ncbi:MAG TPA: hypothetical protein PLY66_15030 [Acidobacteriota bacterium]|nr:hypothetical protein [Acidobacteriota bacterium]HQF85975.1 hypothetical protein [Acidobacteriota bacterium]HQG90782.1 hypothetical protein [Acidobacteriota bacterium]HQK86695.1 hypothetical protein [Acidobacteriota bacterium]